MATIKEFRFEGAIGDDWSSVTGVGGAIDTGVYWYGAQSSYWDCVGSATYRTLSLPASTRIITGRFGFRLKTDVSSTSNLIQAYNVGGDLKLDLRVGRKIRAVVGATTGADSAALTLDQWYLIDFLFDSSTGTASVSWKIDGATQTGSSRAQAAADMTSFLLGQKGTATYQAFVDELLLTGVAGDYPLGIPIVGHSFAVVIA